jgi:hypothetical protein
MMEVIRARSDKAHVACEHVQDLRKFVNPRFPHKTPQRSDAVGFKRIIRAAAEPIRASHTAEFEQTECTTIFAHTWLKIEKRTFVEERVRDEQTKRNDQENRKKNNAEKNVKRPFARQKEPMRAGVLFNGQVYRLGNNLWFESVGLIKH